MKEATLVDAVGVGSRQPPARVWSGVIGYGALGLILAVDQLLLPMFHLGNLPYKLSYVLLGTVALFWFVTGANTHDEQRRRVELLHFGLAMGAVVAAGLLGELWLATTQDVISHAEAWRSTLIYVLAILAFGLGRHAARMRMSGLVWVLIAAVALNLVFALLKSRLPGWLVGLYYDERAVGDLNLNFINDVTDLLELARPRGLFGNPNASALMINIIVLFIQIGLRNGFLQIRSALVTLAVVFMPILLSVVLASRAEFIVASTLGLLNLRWIIRGMPRTARLRLTVGLAMVPLLAAVAVQRALQEFPILENFERVVTVVTNLGDADKRGSVDEGAARPLLALNVAASRVSHSPLFGTGFGSAVAPPFDYGTNYYHNDWLRLLATSGVIGIIAMLWLIARFAWPLGWPIVIPFVLPGLVNTFMLTLPAFIFFWFMVGVLRDKRQARAAHAQ
jgi:hypothetical protein